MCALLIALMIFGAVILAGLAVCLYCLLKISATADETARRIICIAISKGEDHEKNP